MEIFLLFSGELCLAAEEARAEPMGIVSEEEAIDELQKLINQGLTLFPTLIFSHVNNITKLGKVCCAQLRGH